MLVPGKGIQFVFEGAYAKTGWSGWVWDDWEVSILLQKDVEWDKVLGLWTGIAQGKEEFIRAPGELAEKITVERAVIVGQQRPAGPFEES